MGYNRIPVLGLSAPLQPARISTSQWGYVAPGNNANSFFEEGCVGISEVDFGTDNNFLDQFGRAFEQKAKFGVGRVAKWHGFVTPWEWRVGGRFFFRLSFSRVTDMRLFIGVYNGTDPQEIPFDEAAFGLFYRSTGSNFESVRNDGVSEIKDDLGVAATALEPWSVYLDIRSATDARISLYDKDMRLRATRRYTTGLPTPGTLNFGVAASIVNETMATDVFMRTYFAEFFLGQR
jgi:hypothetical protein